MYVVGGGGEVKGTSECGLVGGRSQELGSA